jgi:hypothetical protein
MSTSEYDPLIRRQRPSGIDDLERARALFEGASRAYLASPVPWLVWAIVLPGAALATPLAASREGVGGVVALWSAAVLVGGAVEGLSILRRGGRATTPLGGWAMRLQGNTSMIGLALSLLLVWRDLAPALPGLWLLLIGHSFFLLGGLAFEPMKQAGIIYQIGGLVALWPGPHSLAAFAVASALGNLRIALALVRRGAER